MSLWVKGTLRRPGGFQLTLDLELPDTGVTAIIGSSGSGKSTLLRIIAGLEKADAVVRFGEEVWQDHQRFLAPHKRPLNLVMQQGALFDHLSVRDNLAYALRYPSSVGQAPYTLEGVLQRLDLTAFADAKTHTLSGGQRQRVALGRCLIRPARLWLFDEPLSALDEPTRNNLSAELARLCREEAQPIVYVSHSLPEVLQVANHLVVVEAGRVIASGTPETVAGLIDHPIAEAMDVGGIINATTHQYHPEHELAELRVGTETLWVHSTTAMLPDALRVHIPARDISIARSAPVDSSVLNRLPVVITAIGVPQQGSAVLTLDCAGQHLYARVTTLSLAKLKLEIGDRVYALIKSVALNVNRLG